MKKLVITLAIILFASTTFAQNEGKQRWAHFETNHFWDNWEIGVDAGVQTIWNMPTKKNGEKLNPEGFGKDFTFAFDVYVNKWFTPIFGARLGFTGLSTTNYFTDVNSASVKNENDYYIIHGEALFNLTNWFCGYKPDRFFNASAFVGIGYGSSKNKDAASSEERNLEWTMPIGLLTTYRLCDAFYLSLELKDFIIRNNFHNEKKAKHYADFSNILSVTAGVTYRFKNITGEREDRPTRGFAYYTPIDYSQWVKKADYDNLENEKNNLSDELNKANAYKDEVRRLQQQNNELRDELAKAKANAGKATGNVSGDTQLGIFFKIGSSDISDANQENIVFMANFMKTNKDQKFTVTGYADKETGSEARNNVLSQERAEAVRDALVKAGVSEDQIIVDYKGCKVEPFPGKGYLNRVAIINQ